MHDSNSNSTPDSTSAEHNPPNLRAEIDRFIAEGDFDLASRRLAELWRRDPASGTASFMTSRLDDLRDKTRDKLALTTFKLAILRSFTVEPIVPLLRSEAFAHGIDLEVHVGDFNTYVQDMLDSQSSLYRFAPRAVVLAVRTEQVAPELWRDFADLAPEAAQQAAERVVRGYEQWIGAFRKHSQSALIVHSLERPSSPSLGVLDDQSEAGQSGLIRQINRELRRIAAGFHGVYALDYDALVARHGSEQWHDERKWLTARLPIAAGYLLQMAREWMRFIVPLSGRTAKVLVVDLDNTLWGGVIGEDGMAGIKVGPEYPGAAYQGLHRALLDLSRKGILLAVCSKNNLADAMEALEKHPGMLLRPKHFAAMRINWTDKAQNLREIAQELNVGIEALAFMDDNPFEREQVRAALPEVTVIDLPKNPLEYAAAVRNCAAFERLTLSAEDRQRTEMYAAQKERSGNEQTFQSKEDFFRFLEQEAELEPVTDLTLARVAQLTQKTNQFNLTTRRYTEPQIAEMTKQPGWHVFSIRLRDRFGDHGLVGVAIAHDVGEQCEVDTFLLSCRVIGRTVETALLAHLAESAAQRGRKRLEGWYLPTKKNAPARDFYQQHGFEWQVTNCEGSLWTLDLTSCTLRCPDWIKLKVSDGVTEGNRGGKN
ncbi:MAG TPA: HAD-IIIC family phosphatase [Terriglobales bacterium]|nr:HAD-IIIC family phosphatase [Terriglobales bacterium]